MKVAETYDVIIIGAGPAGIFAALELTTDGPARILMLEKGKDITDRQCPSRGRTCIRCASCSITSGWGGAGAFSDGKLTLSTEVGGWLGEFIGDDALALLIRQVDDIWLGFGAPAEVHGTDPDVVTYYQRQAALADMTLIDARIRHMGTERCYEILKSMRHEIADRVEIRTGTEVSRVLVEKGRVSGVELADGSRIVAGAVIAAPGREGADWLTTEARRHGLQLTNNAVDIGVRVEVPAPVMEPLTTSMYESKLIYSSPSFEDRVRTFCMNPYGEVSTENYGDVITVNGHSYADRKTDNTNFAILVSTVFTDPFKEPIAYGKHIAGLANLLGDGIILQRLGDLLEGHRSTPERIERSLVCPTLRDATPGDLSFVLPYRHLTAIREMLEAMDSLVPGVYSRNTLLYGVEVKFYSSRPELTPTLETRIENLYAIGDGAGVTRGLVQASAAGILAARAILRKGQETA